MFSRAIQIRLAVVALCCIAAGCGIVIPSVLGSGVIVTDTRDVGAFTEIRFLGAGRIEVETGALQPIEVTVDDNIQPLIVTQVSGDTLTVSTSQPIIPSAGLVIRATVPDLAALSVSGSGDFVVNDLDNEAFSIGIQGSGDATVNGQTGELTVSISGSGDIRTEDLVANDVEIRISGSGDARVNAVETLDIAISGSGSVRYTGDPQVSQQVFGSGSVSKVE